MQAAELQQEALTRAVGGMSGANYSAIFAGFAAKGILEVDIRPRENVFTYHAWRALERQVRKGEHGVQILTWVPMRSAQAVTDDNPDGTIGRRPKSSTVFHVSQTDQIVS
mgnify:CR=1 FL=1